MNIALQNLLYIKFILQAWYKNESLQSYLVKLLSFSDILRVVELDYKNGVALLHH
jgi:hypothetical protein